MTALDTARHPPARRNLPGLNGLNTSRTNYAAPLGDPGLFGPDSVAWRVHANPVALAVGGIAAVILELAEPRVRSGVWDHSIFKTDPLTRMQRTGEATLITTYGPTRAAQARIDMVTRMHQRIAGVTPDGQAYAALDPELMTWVHITAGWGFLNAYHRHVAPVSPADQDRYYAEGARVGRAFGAVEVPGSAAEVEAWFDRMRPKLVPHPIIDDFLGVVAVTSPIGLAGRALQPLVAQASIALLPADLRGSLKLPLKRGQLAAANALLPLLARIAAKAPPDEVRRAYGRVGRTVPG